MPSCLLATSVYGWWQMSYYSWEAIGTIFGSLDHTPASALAGEMQGLAANLLQNYATWCKARFQLGPSSKLLLLFAWVFARVFSVCYISRLLRGLHTPPIRGHGCCAARAGGKHGRQVWVLATLGPKSQIFLSYGIVHHFGDCLVTRRLAMTSLSGLGEGVSEDLLVEPTTKPVAAGSSYSAYFSCSIWT